MNQLARFCFRSRLSHVGINARAGCLTFFHFCRGYVGQEAIVCRQVSANIWKTMACLRLHWSGKTAWEVREGCDSTPLEYPQDQKGTGCLHFSGSISPSQCVWWHPWRDGSYEQIPTGIFSCSEKWHLEPFEKPQAISPGSSCLLQKVPTCLVTYSSNPLHLKLLNYIQGTKSLPYP